MEIILLRHGKPDFIHPGNVKASQIYQLLETYNLSPICDKPPPQAIQIAQKCKAVVCSDLLRSVESAKALGLNNIHLSDSIFREAGIPHAGWGFVKLPPELWVIVFRSLWNFGFSKNGESLRAAKNRAKVGCQRLIKLAGEHGTVLFVGHGYLNQFIARELISNGWDGPARPGMKHWDFGVYRYDKHFQ